MSLIHAAALTHPQSTETADIIGGLRPVRGRADLLAQARGAVQSAVGCYEHVWSHSLVLQDAIAAAAGSMSVTSSGAHDSSAGGVGGGSGSGSAADGGEEGVAMTMLGLPGLEALPAARAVARPMAGGQGLELALLLEGAVVVDIVPTTVYTMEVMPSDKVVREGVGEWVRERVLESVK